MTIQNGQFLSIGQVQDQYLGSSVQSKKVQTGDNTSFQKILDHISSEQESVKFSKHAVNRLNDRNIELTQDQMDRLNQATAQAGEKGINESLILVDQLAFIVNVPNNTVVTAMDQKDKNNQIFTNIDGAVIA
ncbi:MAG: flagellar protein [Butyrivibrio sp.]|nr:flagellar protein [Butyrivibrio sp.]